MVGMRISIAGESWKVSAVCNLYVIVHHAAGDISILIP